MNRLLIFVLCMSCLGWADGTIIQTKTASNPFSFPTSSVSVTPTGVGANHVLIGAGFSCLGSCPQGGIQATHAVTDTLGLIWTNISNVLFFDTGAAADWARESVWCAATGSSTGSDTVTLTLNAMQSNGIVVMEVSGLVSCTPIGTSSPVCSGAATGSSCVQAHRSAGGIAPITFTGGSITIGGTANIGTVLANQNNDTDWLIQFVAFQAITGNNLLFIYGSCDNCGGLFQNLPTGYSLQASAIGDGNSVYMTGNALPGVRVNHRSIWK